ncbi:MAG: hypothetical protein ABSE16_00825 [Verrucomicrobiota bacterium]|jgi:LPS-assembly protein
MRRLPAILAPMLLAVFLALPALAQEESLLIQALSKVIPDVSLGGMEYDPKTDTTRWTNGVYVKSGGTVLTADSCSADTHTYEVVADGHVRIEQGDQIWTGEHVRYNYKTHQMQTGEFRTGKSPVFAAGRDLSGNTSNKTYTARHDFVTSDDVSNPDVIIRSSRILIVPGKYVEMWNAVLYVDGVPTFYFPYYRRNLGKHANNFNFLPGYRSEYGPFLMTTYTWYLDDKADGKFHLDYRERRGPGVGPDLNLHLGQWGDLGLKYYYTHDQDPARSTNGLPELGPLSKNRQRLYLQYQATPATNLYVKALVNYQSDPFLLHDFFQGDYTENPQPNTFTEVNRVWSNWSLDAETQPRINDFFDQVERLPDVQLTGYRQQVFGTPLYYDSQSSAGYYRQAFATTNAVMPLGPTLDYSAGRVDTYHQFLLPWQFFDWLNVTPRAGGRFTYYTTESGPGGTNSATDREVFNTGVETSFKASRLWTGATNSLLQIDGLRHIFEPSVNYTFVPNPSTPAAQLPQFDTELPSLLLLPTEFPEYNDIDSIDSENVIRFGLRNTLQTKRDGQIENLVDWNLMLDWRLKPNSITNAFNLGAPAPQQTFDDLYSDLSFRPRTWLTLQSQVRYSINEGLLNVAFHEVTITPSDRWSWGIGHWYLRSGVLGSASAGDNYITSTVFYRLNDNWGLRATHNFNAQKGVLQDQFYSIYRDFRSWTGALTFRVSNNTVGPEDFSVGFSFSLKASPSMHVGDDALSPYHLLGE